MDVMDGYPTRLQGLLVDWGGVLTGSLDGAMASWVRDDAIDYEHFREVLAAWAGIALPAAVGGGDTAGGGGETPVAGPEQAPDAGPVGGSPVHRLERGEMAVAEFEEILADELARRGSAVEAPGLLGRMLSGLESLDTDMVAMVRRARSLGVRTALLSNSWGDHYPEQLWDGLFDEIVISGRVGMRKPEPEIFTYTAHRLGLPPESCVMVDDLPHNVRGAVAVGMVGVLHHTYAETLAELEALFELELG